VCTFLFCLASISPVVHLLDHIQSVLLFGACNLCTLYCAVNVNVPLLLCCHAETLVHSTLEPCEDSDFTFPVHFNLREHTIYVRCRPYLKEFLETVASMFEIIIFTASQSIYAEQLLNVLDPKRRLFRHRVYRESCLYVEGNYLKDLTVLGRDLARVVIVDNSPQVCAKTVLPPYS
jgi:Dullard-like phosphatase family protein